jgi:ribonuclease-3
MAYRLAKLEKKLGYVFKNKALLETALTHKTYAFEASEPIEYNERLEFLGDSVLNFIVAEELYKSNKYFSEGELTRRRSISVNNRFLATCANEFDLGSYLLLGRGETKQQGAENPKILANTLEAVIGAIFLDAGIEISRGFVLDKVFSKKIRF